MTKQLMLMRHAKSGWPEGVASDHERPLTDGGRETASKMARWMQRHGHLPDVILSSTARRTQETVERMLSAWSTAPPFFASRSLYLAPPQAILEVVRSDALESQRVLVVAHNPGLADLVTQLAGHFGEFPPGTLAIFECALGSWANLLPGSQARCLQIVHPKALPI